MTASHSATARQHGSGTTSRSEATATLARRPGATEAQDEGALTYGQHDPKMKVAVKDSSTRAEDAGVARRRRRRTAMAVPQTAPTSFTSSPNLDVTGGASREQTPNWLGFGGEAPAAALIAGGR
jgi:hypothetical protein